MVLTLADLWAKPVKVRGARKVHFAEVSRKAMPHAEERRLRALELKVWRERRAK